MAKREKIEVSVEELNKIIRAYRILGNFLDSFIDRRMLYKDEFTEGLDSALKEVAKKKTKSVKKIDDLSANLYL